MKKAARRIGSVALGLWGLLVLVSWPIVWIGLQLMRIVDLLDNVVWKIRFWRMKRPHKWRPSDEVRGQIVDVIVIGRTLRANVEFFESFGRGHCRDSNREVARIGSQLLMNTKAAKQRLKRLLAGLELRLMLRRYAWPVLRRDNLDLDTFWKIHIENLYTGIEETMERLAMAARPEIYESMTNWLRVQRPALEPPKTPQERERARLQRLKAMLAKRFPMDLSCFRGFVEEGTIGRMEQAESNVQTAYLNLARMNIAKLPEGERTKEMNAVKKLLPKADADIEEKRKSEER